MIWLNTALEPEVLYRDATGVGDEIGVPQLKFLRDLSAVRPVPNRKLLQYWYGISASSTVFRQIILARFQSLVSFRLVPKLRVVISASVIINL